MLLALAALLVVPAAAAIQSIPNSAASAYLAAQTSDETSVLLTLSATGEMPDSNGDPARGTTTGGSLLVQVTLSNQSGTTLDGLALRAPVPARAVVADSWFGEPGQLPALLEDGAAIWREIVLEEGERLGPFAYRLLPDLEAGADGAVIFREARVRPEVTWSYPDVGRAAATALRLNGLWGEHGLRRTLLPSGLTVFTRERPDTPTIALHMAVRAGSRDEDDDTSGGSHWLEHAHFLGTERRPGRFFDAEIGRIGGASNASTGWESTDYWYLVPAEYFDLALDVLADQMVNSTFPTEEFDRERQVVFEELKLRNDSPGTRAFDEFINLVFQVSPLRRHPAGTIESVQSIPIETILTHRDRHYFTGNMAVVASGGIQHDDAVADIERAFAGLPQGPQLDRPSVPEPVQTEPRYLEVETGSQVAEIRLGWSAPGDDHLDSLAMFFLDDILGDTGRRLSEEIRDRRALATSVGSSYFVFSDAGALMLSASTRADQEHEVIRLILEEVRRIRDGDVTEEDLQMSLRAAAGRRALSEETNLGQTGRANVEVSGTLDSSDEYLARLGSVTPGDVRRVAETYLDLANYTLVIVRS